MKILKRIPMFGFLLIIIDLFILFGKGEVMNNLLFKFKLMSGALWFMTVGDLFVIVGLVFLFIEVIKATRTSQAAIIDHILSTLVFIVFLIEFIAVKGAGTSTFFILALMSLFDVIAGFTVTITTARRDVTIDRDSGYVPPVQR
jgi:hypothetical protein